MFERHYQQRPLRTSYKRDRVFLFPLLPKAFYEKFILPIRLHLLGMLSVSILFLTITHVVKAEPIRFGYFDIRLQTNQAILNWQTSSEVNSSVTEIERSVGADNAWELRGVIPAHGTTTLPHDYAFTDDVSGLNTNQAVYIRYRLRFRDLDGSFEYSPVRQIAISPISLQVSLASVVPNPVKNSATVSFAIPVATHVRLGLFDSKGLLVKMLIDQEMQAGNYQQSIVTTDLNSSVYYCRLIVDGTMLTQVVNVIK